MKAPLALLPLDNRPVNLDDPLRLAAMAGATLVTPPDATLGHFLVPGDTDALADWLARTLPATRGAILALDMLAYGGLVASRTPDVTVEEALRRLEVLREIKQRHPGLRLYAFNVIMRLTITGADAETRAAGRDIFRYSILRDQAERLGDAAARAELADVEARIPAGLLQTYLRARARNHAVNRAALALLADGVLDFLALVQEDTAPAGLHVAEQLDLVDFAQAQVAAERWRLYAGTDEAAQTLLARLLLTESGLRFPVTISLRDPQAAQLPALFEDTPLAETARRHVDAVGGTLAPDGLTLAVHTFTAPQQDLFELPPLLAPTWAAALAAYPATDVDSWLTSTGILPVAVADTAYCNGSDPHLLAALLSRGDYPRLAGYAGWNTAGNTLGTTVAMAALTTYAQARGVTPAMATAHRQALRVRLLDDGLYQPIVRGWAMARAEESGASPLNLGSAASAIEAQVAAALQALWHEVRASYAAMAALDGPFRVTLPWGRLFEARIITARAQEEAL